MIGLLAASALVVPVWQPPAATDWGIFVALGIVGSAGQYLLIRSLTVAEAGAVAPFGYSGVVYSTIWGLLVFREIPDAFTMAGALVIVGSGLYVWHREACASGATATGA